MDYIFTEITFDVIRSYSNLTNIFIYILNSIYIKLVYILPFIVRWVIGYCHFYYQLGYGLVFYIYLYRRYRAKKFKNLNYFYGNSVSNWVLFNFLTLNKFVTNKNFLIFFKNQLKSAKIVINFLFMQSYRSNFFLKNVIKIYYSITHNNVKYIWTPIFKRSSYIFFLSFLKRFNKRK